MMAHLWESTQCLPSAWVPTDEFISSTNIGKLIKELNFHSYEELHTWSVQNRAEYWDIITRKIGIQFKQKFTRIIDLSLGIEIPQWFKDAKLNIVDSCFNSPGGSVAIVYQKEDSPISTMTYEELDLLTNQVSNSLIDIGYGPGDAIAIDMPMTAEAVAIYLGIIKAGCVVVSIADSFAAPEIEMRLHLANAKGIFTQDYIKRACKQLPLYTKVVSANSPKAIVLPSGGSVSVKLRDGDITWAEFLTNKRQFSSASCDPEDHTNILFSSGTTGEPKATPWTHTTPIKCAADGYGHHNIQPGDVVAWPTNLGWMMGPWLIYASLINQATIALYYGVPTDRGFGQFVRDAKVNMLGVVPGLVRIWKNTECMKGLDWSAIKVFSSTGECSNEKDMKYLMGLAGNRPIIEYCGGTEIGGGYITGTVVQPCLPAAFSTPALGLDFVIIDENGELTENGEVMLIPPSIGLSTDLLNQDHHKVYFEGTPNGPHEELLRRHGDQIERLAGGYYKVHGRVDDTMNLAGIKVSSNEIERVVNSVPGVSETAAIAIRSQNDGPNLLIIYAVLIPNDRNTISALKTSMQDAINLNLNPLFKIHDIVIVDSLTRTASNKVMRRTLRDNYKGTSLV
jgi:acetyl-CoA synthetase